MKSMLNLSLFLVLLLTFNTFAAGEGEFGIGEEETNMARKTLLSIRPSLDDAMRKVEDVLYPNLQTYSIQTNLALSSTTILMDFVGSTSGKTPSNSRTATSSYTSYKSNPYIARLAIIETGLRIQLKFISSTTGVANNVGTTAKVPMFEPFLGKRIVMVPIFNVAYDSSNTNVVAKDLEITAWECLSDADEGISSSGTTISEGMRSIVSMAGGNLGACQFLTATSLDTIWANI